MIARKNSKDNVQATGQMSVNEAGRRGGEATSQTHGREFYEEIGEKGGRRVSELVEEGNQAEQAQGNQRTGYTKNEDRPAK